MTTATDRIVGLNGFTAWKPPVRVATTANITLSGEQTIDGVAVVALDRVLVKDQTTASENGIYVASAGTWTRATDFNGARDVVTGTMVYVTSGTANGKTPYELTTTGTITIGTTSLSFSGAPSAGLKRYAIDVTADIASTSVPAAAVSIITSGHTTRGDGGGLLFVLAASEPSHELKAQSADGRWWEGVPVLGIVNARSFGFLEAGTAAANATAMTNVASYINDGNFQQCIFPAGIYALGIGSTTVGTASVNFGLSRSDVTIDWRSAKFTHDVTAAQLATAGTSSAIVFDLNINAVAAESSITSRIKLLCGHLLHGTPYATTANALTGIRARGVTRVVIEGAWLEDMHVGIAVNPRDGMTIRECNGFQNGIHLHFQDYQTSADNPQNVAVRDCWWGLHYDKGVYIEGNASQIIFDGGYYIGEHAIVIENGSSQAANFNNDGIHIENIDFEQGTLVTLTGSWTFTSGSTTVSAPGTDGAATTELAAGYRVETAGGVVYTVASVTNDDAFELTANASATESTVTAYRAKPYIDVLDTNSHTLYNLNIVRCKFSAFDGVTTTAHVLHLRDVTGWTFSNNIIAARAPGWIWIDSACTDGHYGPTVKTSTANLIHFDCGREEIAVTPSVIDFPAYNGNNGNLIFNATAVSDADSQTVDASATIAAAYWPDDIPPRGYTIALGARDSGSAAAGAGAAYIACVPTSATSANERFRYVTCEVAGFTDDRYLFSEGYCPADDNGDFHVYVNATGTDTLDAYATIKRIWM